MTSMLLAATCCMFSLPGAEASLKVGDPAPPIKVERWVKEGPVDLAAGRGQKVYVVEFWATWCGPCVQTIPHVTRMAKRFEKAGVVVRGISIDEGRTRDKVDPFVKAMGKKMDYNVALDGGAMRDTWMIPAGVRGIPHAFVVGKDGKIAWQGHPLNGLDLKLAELTGDTEYAEKVRKSDAFQKALGEAIDGEEWGKALQAIEGLIALDPEDTSLLFKKYQVLVLKKDREGAAKCGLQIVQKEDSAERLNGLSWGILTGEEYEGARDLPLALAAAKKADDLSEGKSWAILDTHARALFEMGNAREAIDIQKKAVDLAKKDDAEKEAQEELEQSLVKYQKADKAGAAAPGASRQPSVEPGFASLFDGKDITRDFVVKGSPESWKADGGVLRAAPGGDRIVSREKYGDFALRLEWRVSAGGNSGVFIRVPSQDDGAPWETGFEVQISNEGRDDAHCTGSLYGVQPAQPRPDETPGIWHSTRIVCLGKRVTVDCDGARTVDATYDANPEMAKRPIEGYIGLQDSHSGPGSTIEYRNIRIERLLPDGTIAGFRSLTSDGKGWHTIRTGHGSGGRWTFEKGTWIGEQEPPGSGNGGILVTDGMYGDFEVVFETRPDWGDDSGFFLRSSDKGQCYQILVDYLKDGAVGGIYGEGIGGFGQMNYSLRAVNAIDAKDCPAFPLPFDPADWKKVWNPEGFNEVRGRITGNPPAIDVWLNGVYITHFADKEKRLDDTGRIGLQVHGGEARFPKGNQVRFRNIQVREIGK